MINDFRDEYSFLSNFYYSPITYDGITYPTMEHYFQAMKTTDQAKRKEIANLETPSMAKRAGRMVDLRPEWEGIKMNVMRVGLRQKFAEGTTLRQKLLATRGEDLEEGNTWHDCYWGKCYCSRCGGHGMNRLGSLLMEVRDNDPT